MKRVCMTILAVSLAAVLLVGCGSSGGSVESKDLAGKVFVLQRVNGQDFKSEIIDFPAPMLSFANDLRVNGKVCNNFFGTASLTDSTLKVNGLGSTRMACPDEALGTVENLLIQLLEQGAAANLQDGKLTLTGKPGTLVFTPAQ